MVKTDHYSNNSIYNGIDMIKHCLRTDLEANLALFYADVGIPFGPTLLDSDEEF